MPDTIELQSGNGSGNGSISRAAKPPVVVESDSKRVVGLRRTVLLFTLCLAQFTVYGRPWHVESLRCDSDFDHAVEYVQYAVYLGHFRLPANIWRILVGCTCYFFIFTVLLQFDLEREDHRCLPSEYV